MPRSSIPRARKPKSANAFTRQLLVWYQRHARDLPWRRTRDPYRVLVSEFMLQQTQVSRVAEYYPRFLERFPDLTTLARAPARAVREAWEGLGYYARVRNLHRLAKHVTRRHDGTLPEEPHELLELPGIGPYTAGAVATFAYERPVPAVDTNVARVVRRVFFGNTGSREQGAVRDGARRRSATHRKEQLPAPSSQEIWAIARALMPETGKRAWKFNQAMMDLGALICVARKPKCPECPVRVACKTGRRLDARRTASRIIERG